MHRFARIASAAAMSTALLLCLLALGCGGDSAIADGTAGQLAASGPMGSTATAGRGSLAFSINWPAREEDPSRLVPAASECILIQVLDGRQNVVREVKALYGITEVIIDEIPAGSYVVVALAKPNADGTGVTQAMGQSAVNVVAGGQPTRVPLTMSSRIANFVIEGPNLTVGGLSTLTATARNAKGEVVLLPAPGSSSWTLTPASGQVATDATELVYNAGQGGDQTKYTISLLGRSVGVVHVQATVDEDGSAGPAMPIEVSRDLEIVAIRESPGASDAGYRQEYGLHDELLLNQGWDSATGRQKPSPFEDVDPVADVYRRTPGANTTFQLTWSSDERSHASGATIDASVEASYEYGLASVSGSASTSYENARREDSYKCSLHQTYYKDYGEYWIQTNKLRLRPEALKLLAESPARFVETYGDRFVVGDKRWAYLTTQYSCSSMSQSYMQSIGVDVTVDGRYGNVSGSASVSTTSWLNDAVSHTGVDVVVATNADAAPQIGEIIRESVAKGNSERSRAIVNQIGAIAGNIDSTHPTQYRMVVVPMSWVLPALNRPYQPFPGSVGQHMRRLQRLVRQRTLLAPIIQGVGSGGRYAFLPATRKADLQAAASQVDQAIAAEEETLQDFFASATIPAELSDSEMQGVPLKWPDPYIVVDQFDERHWIRKNLNNSYAWGWRTLVNLSFHALDVSGDVKAVLVGPNIYTMPFTGTPDNPSWGAEVGGYFSGDPNYMPGGGVKDPYYWVGEQSAALPVRLQDPADDRIVYHTQVLSRRSSTQVSYQEGYW